VSYASDWELTSSPPISDAPPRPGRSGAGDPTTQTPLAPPLQPPHLPPTPPPLPPQYRGGPPSAPTPRRPRGRLVAGLAIGAALAGLTVGAFGVNRLLDDGSIDAAAPAATTARSESTRATVPDPGDPAGNSTADSAPSSAESTPRSPAPETPPAPPVTATAITPATGLEPVAAAAREAKPAVVQLETNFGLGSGFVYDHQGNILTAAHVVDGARSVTVRLADGRRVPGSVVGTDDNTDVAVVRIDQPIDDLPVAALAVGVELVEGQSAIAIGSPFGLQQTVTAGIVSAVNRPVQVGNSAIPMIQTDAPINSGNSGGPLVDLQGRVIGINDQIRTNTGDNAGIGFAIPIDIAYDVAVRMVGGQPLEYGYLGVSSGGEPAFGAGGALITKVEADSPADRAGLEVGDVVFRMDGTPITSFEDLFSQVRSRRPGDSTTMDVRRGDQQLTVTVTLGTGS